MFVRVSKLLILIGFAGLVACLHVSHASAIGTVPTGFTEEQIWATAAGTQPVGFTFLPDGRVLYVEQKLKTINVLTMTPRAAAAIFTVPDVVTAGNEQGLLGIAVDPGWPARPYLYVHFDHPGQVIYLRRYTAAGSLSDPTSTAITLSTPYDIITDIPDVMSNHNGGTVHFGTDGMLYESLGDDDPHYLPGDHCAAQDVTLLMGKIVRLDVSALPDTAGGPPPRALITPSDNPFVANPNANARLVYNLGLRNPFRFTIDPASNVLYIGDVGENLYEEEDQGQSGDNFGWPRREGLHPYSTYTCGIDGENPMVEYPHAGSASIVGGPRYRLVRESTAAFTSNYDGSVFFAEYYGGWIRRVIETSPGVWATAPAVPGQPTADRWTSGISGISDLQEGPDGALWYVKQYSPASIRRIKGTGLASVGEIGPGPGPLAIAASPNPGRASSGTAISYTLPAASRISIAVYDLAGARVATVFEGRKESGSYQVSWNGVGAGGREVAPGVYFVRLESAGGASVSSKIALVR